MQVIPPVNLQYSLPSYPNDHQSKHLTVSINNAQKHFKIHGIFEKPKNHLANMPLQIDTI